MHTSHLGSSVGSRLGRRDVLAGVAALVAGPASALAASSPLIVTPGQTEGPFYPVSLPADMDADLVLVQGQTAQALGQITHISGRVLDRRGGIVRAAMVEIWQCDAHGIYNHPRAPGHDRHDSGFQGYGRTQVDAAGRYAFRTIRPVAYPGRTPHIHYKIKKGKKELLTTQCYIKGHPGNERAGIWRSVRDPKARDSITVDFTPIKESRIGEVAAKFDIVLGYTPEA